MELTYTKCGDYLIPDLVLSDTKEYHIGKYGRLRRAYLKEHRPILYTDLIVTEKLFPHLEEIDIACRERLEIIEKATKKCNLKYRRMISGAGHDACHISKVAPTAMIFIPCAEGISHNETESATKEDLAAGTQILLETLVELADQ